jgi:hypothetical protein
MDVTKTAFGWDGHSSDLKKALSFFGVVLGPPAAAFSASES